MQGDKQTNNKIDTMITKIKKILLKLKNYMENIRILILLDQRAEYHGHAHGYLVRLG